MLKKYLTLEEAAVQLGVSKDELVRLRERGAIRGFADRGTWKFKVEDVETLARERQADSDPEVRILGTRSGGSAPDDAGADNSSAVLRPGEKEFHSSDSDVRLMMDATLTPAPGSDPELTVGPLDDSDSDIKVAGTLADSDSDVKLVEDDSDSDVKMVDSDDDSGSDITLGDSDSDVKLVGDDSDSDIALTPSALDKTDSDVQLVRGKGDVGSDITLAPPIPSGSDSDVRLVPDSLLSGSDSDVQLIGSSVKSPDASDSDIALIGADDAVLSLDLGGAEESGSVLAEESGIALTGDSSMTLASESGISLEGPADSGISLDLDDEEGITLAEGIDSGIALEMSGDSGIALRPDANLGGTIPLMPAARMDDSVGETQFEIPSLSGDSEFEFEAPKGKGGKRDADTGVLDLDDSSGEQTALLDALGDSGDLDESVFDVDDDAASTALSDELEFDEAVDEEASMEDMDVFEEEGEFEEGFSSGTSHAELKVAPARMAAPEADWGTGLFAGLLTSTTLLVLLGILMFDLIRSMWMWNEPTPLASMLLNVFGGLYK
jgi:excisionase family DNA binding protein